MQHLGIYLVMKGNCEEAFNYYQSIFGGWNTTDGEVAIHFSPQGD